MEEIITLNNKQYKLESNVQLTSEQKNNLLQKINATVLNIGSATNCITTPIKIGTSKTFQCTASGGNGSYNYKLTIGSVIYNSPPGSGAFWNQQHNFNVIGVISPIKLEVTDTCTGSTYSDTATCPTGITVQSPILTTLVLIGSNVPIEINNTAPLLIAATDQFGDTFSTTGKTFTSSNPNIASVNSNGIVTGISEGSAIITVTLSGKSATTAVNIKAACSQPTCNFKVIT